MAKEPDSLVLRLLRDIRATQDTQGATLKEQSATLKEQNATLEEVKNRIEDLYEISTHTLGVAANAHVVERLEAKR
jgi:hypothetical protein